MSNHIDHIEITNFKSIRHQKIEGCKRINVFIGYPNVGKSAILEAVSAFAYFQDKFDIPFDQLCRVKNSNELFYNGDIKKDAVVQIEAGKVSLNYIGENDYNLLADILSSDNSWNRFKNVHYAKVDSKEFQFGIKSSGSFSKNDLVNLPVVKKYIFKGYINDKKTNGLKLFFPFGENLVDIIQFNKEVRKEVAELFKFYNLKLLIDQATNSVRGLKEIDEETIFTIPFYQMADTLQRLIFHKAAILSNENTALLFEEPEAHMFPPYIRKFTGDVIYDKNDNQYFISTHSPIVIEDFMEDAREDLSVYLVGQKDGETIIKRIPDEELDKIHKFNVDLFFNIESYLD